jgi:hypothetical protein
MRQGRRPERTTSLFLAYTCFTPFTEDARPRIGGIEEIVGNSGGMCYNVIIILPRVEGKTSQNGMDTVVLLDKFGVGETVHSQVLGDFQVAVEEVFAEQVH